MAVRFTATFERKVTRGGFRWVATVSEVRDAI
jgi:hypothetical protein